MAVSNVLDYSGNPSGARRAKKRSSGDSPVDSQTLRSSGRQINVRVKRTNNPPPGQVSCGMQHSLSAFPYNKTCHVCFTSLMSQSSPSAEYLRVWESQDPEISDYNIIICEKSAFEACTFNRQLICLSGYKQLASLLVSVRFLNAEVPKRPKEGILIRGVKEKREQPYTAQYQASRGHCVNGSCPILPVMGG